MAHREAANDHNAPLTVNANTNTNTNTTDITRWIQQAYDDINTLLPIANPQRPFVFVNSPATNGPFVWPNLHHHANTLHINRGLYALKSTEQANRQFLAVFIRLQDIFSFALRQSMNAPDPDSQLDEFLLFARQKMDHLVRLKEIEWARQRGDTGVDVPYVNNEIYFQPIATINRAQKVSMITALVMENIFFVPRRALRVLLGSVRSIARASGASQEDLALIPKDPRSGPYRARLDPITQQFVVCPSCHYLYPYRSMKIPRSVNIQVGENCNQHRTPDSPRCNTPLWKKKALGNGQTQTVPIRTYLYQGLKSWIGRLLARKGMEQLLNSQQDQTQSQSSQSPIRDIWTSKVFLSLKGAHGERFFPGPSQELRLVFSLSVDSFNPFHMKTAKQSVSSTGIWMVLLNLPQHLRHRQENIYVAGVIPGPDKPPKEDIYPYIELVIQELLEFWHTGVRYSCTRDEPRGTLVKAMLVPLICDMLAARQIAGLSSATSHHFCTFCDLDIDDINVLDRSEWPNKDLEHIRHNALLWKGAANQEDRDTIFNAFGIMWSPLHRLPYWNIVRYTVIDPMHALDLNLFQNHCRSIFQIDTKYNGGDGLSPASRVVGMKQLSADNLRRLRQCVTQIRTNGPDLIMDLVQHPRLILYTICIENHILGNGHHQVVGTKWILAKNIHLWRNHPNYQDVILNNASLPPIEMTNTEQGQDESPLPPLPSEGDVDRKSVARVLRTLLNTDDPAAAREKAFTQGSAAIFAHICGLVDTTTNNIDMRKKNAKRVLFDSIISRIDDNPEILQELESLVPDTTSHIGGSSRVVLGRDVMESIWEDMRRTILPTWITPAPANWGTAQRGKLSANHWRVVCTIHLPITLIRLWASGSDRKKSMLRHFMDLVSAVQIANMHITSENQIQAYDKYMGQYISTIKELFPDEKLKPTHHAALHIGDMLGLFGPNHSHNGAHYERYINYFHKVNTNSKIGQLEATLLNASARSANTRALLADDEEARSDVSELISVIDKVELEDARGFKLASILDAESPTRTLKSKSILAPLEPIYHTQLCSILGQGSRTPAMPKMATFLNEIALNGVCYGVSNGSTFKNSSIIFSAQHDANTSIKAGIISEIFQYQYTAEESNTAISNIFLLVKTLERVEPHLDPYREFEFGGFLCRITIEEELIPLSMVKSHFVSTRFGDLIHVLPTDKMVFEFPMGEDVHHRDDSDMGGPQ